MIKNPGARKTHKKKCESMSQEKTRVGEADASVDKTAAEQSKTGTGLAANRTLAQTNNVKCPTCDQVTLFWIICLFLLVCYQEFVPGRGLKTHMNWHKRNTTAVTTVDSTSCCRVCGKVAKSPSSLALCEKSHRK